VEGKMAFLLILKYVYYHPMTSCPFRMAGMHSCWTGVGLSTPVKKKIFLKGLEEIRFKLLILYQWFCIV